jgi:hypothetical protein
MKCRKSPDVKTVIFAEEKIVNLPERPYKAQIWDSQSITKPRNFQRDPSAVTQTSRWCRQVTAKMSARRRARKEKAGEWDELRLARAG